MPKPSIVAYENGVTVTNPTAAQLVGWALAAHLETCRSCKNEACPTGAHLEAASQPDRSWIPQPRTGA